MKLNELLQSNRKEILSCYELMRETTDIEKKLKLCANIEYYLNEVKKVRHAYLTLKLHGLLSEKTFEKYDDDIAQFNMNLSRVMSKVYMIQDEYSKQKEN